MVIISCMNMPIDTALREISYPHQKEPEPGSSVEIAPGILWLSMPMPSSLAFINVYLLRDNGGWWIVDTGLSDQKTSKLWERVISDIIKPDGVKGMICTHMHPDHIGQAGVITDLFRSNLFMTRTEYYQARAFANNTGNSHSNWIGQSFYEKAGMDKDYLEQVGKMWANRKGDSMSMPGLPSGYERMEDGDNLNIGGRKWQIIVGSGHSPEHACLYCEEDRVLLSGDQILPVITSNVSVHASEPRANPMKNWMDSHEYFLSKIPDDTFVLPGHNLPFFGVKQRLHDLIEHHEERMRLITDYCETPQIAKDLLPILFNRALDPRQTMMALGEAIAHVHLLLERGGLERITRENDSDLFKTKNAEENS